MIFVILTRHKRAKKGLVRISREILFLKTFGIEITQKDRLNAIEPFIITKIS